MSEQPEFHRLIGKDNTYPDWKQAEVWIRGDKIALWVGANSNDACVELTPNEVKQFAAYLLEAVEACKRGEK